jgi:hypothetical protein
MRVQSVHRSAPELGLAQQQANRAALAPGDVILLSGRGVLQSRLQRHMGSPWDQTGIVVDWPTQGGVAMLLATSRPVCDDLHGRKKFVGVQIVSIDALLRAYIGAVALRALRPVLTQAQRRLLSAFATQEWGLPFNMSPFYSARALHRRNAPGKGVSYYCTELIATAYQHVSVLQCTRATRSASNYVPRDFAEETESLALSEPYRFDAQKTLADKPAHESEDPEPAHESRGPGLTAISAWPDRRGGG